MAVDIANDPPTTVGPNVTLAPPLTIDGTGQTTVVPLTIKNAKTQSGVEVQVTGTVASGFVLKDSSGTAKAAFGYQVGATDWFTSGGVAGDLAIAIPSGQSLEIGVLNGTGNLFKVTSAGVITINGTLDLAGAVFKIPSSNSTTSVGAQVTGDPNTGVGQVGGADTLSIVAGGTESVRVSATAITLTAVQALLGTTNFGSSSNTFQGGANLILATSTGTKIATAANQMLAFWGSTPVVQQVLATGAAATVDNVITFLQTIGLCKQA